MVATRFEELECWQLACELERRVLAFINKPPASHDVEYCRQIRKSTSSPPANIAEGFGRYYPGDFARFMRNALGSLHETRNHLGGRSREAVPDGGSPPRTQDTRQSID